MEQVNTMVWTPNDETQNRVLYALRLMQSKGIGIERAAKTAKTTRRSVRRYGEHLGVKFKGKEGQALQFVGQPIHKIEDFLIKMHGGTSATKAARELKTTVRTMSKQNYKGQSIISKSNGRWVSQFIVEEKIIMDFYGHIKNPQGNTLGGNNVSGPHATSSSNKSKRDPDYMEIWWDALLTDFGTTFATPGEAQKFWTNEIIKVVKQNMESLGMKDAKLMSSFQTNPTVLSQMKKDSRVPPPYTVSPLESLTSRYGVSIEGVKVGTPMTYESRSNVNLIPKNDFKGKNIQRNVNIQFTVSYFGRTMNQYPTPKKFNFKYSLGDEQ